MIPDYGFVALAFMVLVAAMAMSWANGLRRKRCQEEFLLNTKQIQGEQP